MRATLAQLAAACAVIAALAPAAAQADPLVTDRPNVAESSIVVGDGRIQIETGYLIERNRADGLSTRASATPLLLRYGVGDAFELRVETDGYSTSRIADSNSGGVVREHGWADTSIGFKWHQQDGDASSHRPSIGWLIDAAADTGSPAFRGKGVRPSVRVSAEWQLPADVSLGVMPGVTFDRRDDGGHFTSGQLAVAANKSWTPQVSTFVEFAAQQLAAKKNGGNVLSFDFGGAFLIDDSMQIDIGFFRGLTHETPDWQATAGFSIRF